MNKVTFPESKLLHKRQKFQNRQMGKTKMQYPEACQSAIKERAYFGPLAFLPACKTILILRCVKQKLSNLKLHFWWNTYTCSSTSIKNIAIKGSSILKYLKSTKSLYRSYVRNFFFFFSDLLLDDPNELSISVG